MNPIMFDPIALENWYSDDENSLLLQTELEKYFHLCGWDMKNNIIRDGSKDGFQVMILKMKNIIEKANANKTAICFYSAVCVGNAIRFASSGYAAFSVFSSKGGNRYSSFL